jgi:hypothetical protein
MNRGKDLRDPKGEPTKPEAKEVPVLMFVMVEKSPGAFTLRLVCNEDVLSDIRTQGPLDTFLADVDELYADFRGHFGEQTPPNPPCKNKTEAKNFRFYKNSTDGVPALRRLQIGPDYGRVLYQKRREAGAKLFS